MLDFAIDLVHRQLRIRKSLLLLLNLPPIARNLVRQLPQSLFLAQKAGVRWGQGFLFARPSGSLAATKQSQS